MQAKTLHEANSFDTLAMQPVEYILVWQELVGRPQALDSHDVQRALLKSWSQQQDLVEGDQNPDHQVGNPWMWRECYYLQTRGSSRTAYCNTYYSI